MQFQLIKETELNTEEDNFNFFSISSYTKHWYSTNMGARNLDTQTTCNPLGN